MESYTSYSPPLQIGKQPGSSTDKQAISSFKVTKATSRTANRTNAWSDITHITHIFKPPAGVGRMVSNDEDAGRLAANLKIRIVRHAKCHWYSGKFGEGLRGWNPETSVDG